MIRLLYIDDNPDSCTIMSSFCDRIGAFTLQVLGSGESALEWLSRSAADVIVSDYDMPGGINGITLLRELRCRGSTTPFILFTAVDSPEIRDEAFRYGAFGIVSKTRPGQYPIHHLIRTVFWAVGGAVPG